MQEGFSGVPSKFERVPDSVLISEIPTIQESGIVAVTRESLSALVEAPLLEACEALYDMNIETVMSSANAKDVNGGGWIAVSFDSLSEENKKVALQFGQPQVMHGSREVRCVNTPFPIKANTTVGEVRRISMKAVSKFHKQKMTWASRHRPEDLARAFGISSRNVSPEDFPDMYYDPRTGYLFDTEEHYRKFTETE